jgi:DNA-binding winged helix-turn-helix (wHTH) protein
VASEVPDIIQTLAAHGFRLTAHINAEQAASSAAKAATMDASKTIMTFSESI